MATKAEIIEQLKNAGIEHDPSAKKEELEALLPKGEKPTEQTSVVVCDTHGHPHRTYSLEVHGENFWELAEQYISRRPGWSLK